MKIFNVSIIFIVVGIAAFNNSYAQSKKYFFSIGQDKHFIEEFNYAYSKNNLEEGIKKDSIDAYLELYINFRLKVKEAKELGYDTTTIFKEEFEQYKTQLEDSYLNPKKEKEALVKEAYERSLWEMRASHILIRVAEDAQPNDTLVAIKKINEIKKRALNGEDFSDLAKIKSDDPSAKQNGGDLGYFSVFQMVYPFENAAYSTPVGSISDPIRTQFGYHIIKVIDKRTNEGKVQVAHIMIRSTAKNAEDFQQAAKLKAFELDSLLKSGGDWNELCKKNSEDQNSVPQNGLLKPFGRGQIVPEFEQAAFKLSNVGEISEPVKTQFGWHIIKMVNKIPIGSYEEEKGNLARRLKSDTRSSMPKNEMLKVLKEENGFYANSDAAKKIADFPSSVIAKNKWRFDSLQVADKSILFSVGEISITQGEFLQTLQGKSLRSGNNQKNEMNKSLQAFEDSLVISYEKSRLPLKYPDFSFLEKEYYDGILLFSIMEDSVWNRSMRDSVGLNSYYLTNKLNYTTQKIDTVVFMSNSKSELDSIAITSNEVINVTKWKALNSKLLKENNVSPLTLHVVLKEEEKWSEIVSFSKLGKEPFKYKGNWYWIKQGEAIDYIPLQEIKGKVISDYQSYLDKKWIDELRKKYPIRINKKQLSKVYAHFEAIN